MKVDWRYVREAGGGAVMIVSWIIGWTLAVMGGSWVALVAGAFAFAGYIVSVNAEEPMTFGSREEYDDYLSSF